MSVAIESLLFAASEVEIVAASKVPTVNIVAYTGGLMSVSGWGPIVVDLKGIDASAEQIGILADHDASLKGIVGHGVDTELGYETLANGVSRMLAQRDEEHRDLDIRPRTLLVAPEMQWLAKQLLQSEYLQRLAESQPTGNAMKAIVNLEVEPRLSNPHRFKYTSPKSWYLFGSPADAPIVVAFLQGKQTPTVEFFGLDSEPHKLAASWRVYFDYGCALGDFRAAYKAKGEA